MGLVVIDSPSKTSIYFEMFGRDGFRDRCMTLAHSVLRFVAAHPHVFYAGAFLVCLEVGIAFKDGGTEVPRLASEW